MIQELENLHCLKDSYHKNIQLQCNTCGGENSFHTDKVTGKITCFKCNRVYHGGYDELVNLNQRRIDDELQLVVEDVKKDLQKELLKALKIK